MKISHFAGLLLGTAFVLVGCNVQTNAGPKPADSNAAAAAPAAPAAPAPAAPAAEGGGAPSAEVQGAARQNFTIVNNTGHIVVTLNVSPSNENSWGPDILGRDTLGSGETVQITFPHDTSQCNFDIRATYDDGDSTDERSVNLCQIGTVTLTP